MNFAAGLEEDTAVNDFLLGTNKAKNVKEQMAKWNANDPKDNQHWG